MAFKALANGSSHPHDDTQKRPEAFGTSGAWTLYTYGVQLTLCCMLRKTFRLSYSTTLGHTLRFFKGSTGQAIRRDLSLKHA